MPSINVLSVDTYLSQAAPATNFETGTVLSIGNNTAGSEIRRALVKPDFSLIPPGSVFNSVSLNLFPNNDGSSNARTLSAHRVLRAVNYTQTTWNVFSTGNNWGTAGCSNSSTDYDGSVALGTVSVPANPTLGVALTLTFTPSGILELYKMYDGTYVNNGIVLFVNTQISDRINYDSLNSVTPALRPTLVIDYSTPSNFFMYF